MSLYEMGRMNYDRKLYAQAIGYFARVEPEFERRQLDTQDPLGMADYLDEYATALEQTGKIDQAKSRRARAGELRQTFRGRQAHTEKTPYGTQCASERQ